MSDLLTVIQRLQTQVNELAARVPTAPIWANVTSVSPLRIRFDRDTEEVEATPHNAAGTLKIGMRVLAQLYGTQLYVWGPPAPYEPDIVVVNGVFSVASASTNFVDSPLITLPTPATAGTNILVTPDINPSGIVTVGVAAGVAAGSSQFSMRYKTITGTATNRSLKWTAFIPKG